LPELASLCPETELEQTALIVVDFLMTDYAFHKFGLISTAFKSAASANGL
jgi:hypothetical protein